MQFTEVIENPFKFQREKCQIPSISTVKLLRLKKRHQTITFKETAPNYYV